MHRNRRDGHGRSRSRVLSQPVRRIVATDTRRFAQVATCGDADRPARIPRYPDRGGGSARAARLGSGCKGLMSCSPRTTSRASATLRSHITQPLIQGGLCPTGPRAATHVPGWPCCAQKPEGLFATPALNRKLGSNPEASPAHSTPIRLPGAHSGVKSPIGHRRALPRVIQRDPPADGVSS